MVRSGTELIQDDDGRFGWMALSSTYRWELFPYALTLGRRANGHVKLQLCPEQ
ncbi:hypothetical protein [Vibrio alginolyticus]|uniref:hypothetical protein n=1 Tax=Vibrio alginolyticus TaxID=663 RepID=UPI00215C2DD0|nr:hypothetical protein [Vibrio alginolyticus]MCR9352116.1 hypothetical protein [Vibrio alginolyticus]MCR9362551.1 hypothetical protein [Vibrio alginolyticus]